MVASRKRLFAVKSVAPLPKPPIPTLDHTLDRYIEYAEVVAEGRHHPLQRTQRAVRDFREAGLVYQERLLRLAETEENWINQFWLPEAYLRFRTPLPVYSSPAYISPHQHFEDEDDWLRYTALLIKGFVECKNKIDTKQLEREVSTGKLKTYMCMQQYDRIMGCYRQPATNEDLHLLKPKRNTENEHILVMSRNQAFVVHTRVDGNLLPFADIFFQLRQVLRMSEARKGLAVAVGAAGVGNRDRAARFWSAMQEVETNSISLTWARDALFVVCLDDDETKSASAQHSDADSQSHESNLIQQGKHILTGGGSSGHGLNRWYDATIQLIVSSNGTNGICLEHSVGEGIVPMNVTESAFRYERENRKRFKISRAEREMNPKSLTWHVGADGMEMLRQQASELDELTNELDLEVLIFDDFGRIFMKKSGFSPDGFVQLALQLAHYKLHGCLVSSYETASLRRFRAGRVEIIRANTREALQWVKAMTKNESKETRLVLMRRAAEKQALITQESLVGHGFDNHLVALSVLARHSVESGEIESLPDIFQDPLWKEMYRFALVASQLTMSSDVTDRYTCFGAMVRDGYGCAYNLQNDTIIFSPSAFKSNPRTNLAAFKDSIRSALYDMRNLLEN
ncbi:Choline O-acetyltransferase [Trichostrongylus colubriformis]|uniref:Choline O-acetyltransferase n=1 Tax=Trichostrongylus colubriformis TaxID=6319 RepID=A0AAN8G3H6_TRICO